MLVVEKHLKMMLSPHADVLLPREIGILQNVSHAEEVLVTTEIARRHITHAFHTGHLGNDEMAIEHVRDTHEHD